jgi:hypothetical protein
LVLSLHEEHTSAAASTVPRATAPDAAATAAPVAGATAAPVATTNATPAAAATAAPVNNAVARYLKSYLSDNQHPSGYGRYPRPSELGVDRNLLKACSILSGAVTEDVVTLGGTIDDVAACYGAALGLTDWANNIAEMQATYFMDFTDTVGCAVAECAAATAPVAAATAAPVAGATAAPAARTVPRATAPVAAATAAPVAGATAAPVAAATVAGATATPMALVAERDATYRY